MNKLKILKLKRLLKELEYLEYNYTYIQDIISEADNEFMHNVSYYLENNPNIKEVYNKKIEQDNKRVLEEIKKNDNVDNVENDDIIENKEPSKGVKKLYRDIVKLTHPDKVSDDLLNNIYIESTKLYENDDKIGLYKICDKLNIDYQIEENDEEYILYKITDFNKKIGFLESTFTWKWVNTNEDKEKDDILLHFINMKIR